MRALTIILAILGFIAIPRMIPEPIRGVPNAVEHFTTEAKTFAATTTALRKTLEGPINITLARQRLIECRAQYKQIESFLEYFFRSSATIYNKPPKFEAEEPDMEYQSPIGLQVIESLLYEKHIDKKDLLEQAKAVESAAVDLPALLYEFKATDRQLLESLRLELIRIIALDITGYEAPMVKSGIKEANTALRSIRIQLQPYSPNDTLEALLTKALNTTAENKNFDDFDRLSFLKNIALPLQRQLSLLIKQKGLEYSTNPALNYEADDLFSPDALTPMLPKATDEQIALGKKLFFDPTLSTNRTKSCASCHNPQKAFTDGLPKSLAFDGHHSLPRNAPTLLYSGFQYRQFWDGRAATLETQINTVLHDPNEMNADTTAIVKKGGTKNIVRALAAYVRSLHPMNSPFDRWLRGPDSLLSQQAKRGANLFLGKAQCATCHFMPLFNGLIPPYYAGTEFEVLGTTTTDHLNKPTLSKDSGRYNVYPFPFYKGAFKTPTVRNSASTAPYMHNGAFNNLEKLMDFYNKGGGAGLGLNVPNQTLAATPLHLSKTEMQDIIVFIHTLTDDLNTNP